MNYDYQFKGLIKFIRKYAETHTPAPYLDDLIAAGVELDMALVSKSKNMSTIFVRAMIYVSKLLVAIIAYTRRSF